METLSQADGGRSGQKSFKKIVRKQRIVKRKWKMNENRTRVRFEKRVKELVSTGASNYWKTFKDGILKECDEACGWKEEV